MHPSYFSLHQVHFGMAGFYITYLNYKIRHGHIPSNDELVFGGAVAQDDGVLSVPHVAGALFE